jgi:hypothetical protein
VNRALRFAATCITLVILAGCSTVRFAYDNADAFIRWRAGQFLDLHDEAADELDERIEAFLRWHRTQALPEYAREADDAARRVARGLSREDLLWGYDSFVTQARRSLRAGAERIAPLLDRLTPEQVKHIEQRIVEENRKFARENLRGSERARRERRAQRIIDRLEDWLGNLSKAQVERIRQYSERAPLIDALRDRDNKRLQVDVLAIIRAREAQKRLADRVVNWEKGRDPAYVAARAAFWREFNTLLLDIDRMGTPEQRARVVAQFRRYAEDFRALATRVPEGGG